jgi:hypothetical protein
VSGSGHVVFYKYWPGWNLLWTLLAIVLVGGGCGAFYYREFDPLLRQRAIGIWLATGLIGGVVLVLGTARLWFDTLRTSSRPPGRGPKTRG